jgi:hypothetical protein
VAATGAALPQRNLADRRWLRPHVVTGAQPKPAFDSPTRCLTKGLRGRRRRGVTSPAASPTAPGRLARTGNHKDPPRLLGAKGCKAGVTTVACGRRRRGRGDVDVAALKVT